MYLVTRQEWQKIFDQPLLDTFKGEVEEDTGLSLPALPAYGNLDLNLADAKYFFN